MYAKQLIYSQDCVKKCPKTEENTKNICRHQWHPSYFLEILWLTKTATAIYTDALMCAPQLLLDGC